MKKYGRKRQHIHGYKDLQLPKGYKPWWEGECHNGKSKKIARREAKKEIKNELQFS